MGYFHNFGIYPIMEYCNYFKSKFERDGFPKLSIDQLNRLLNIIYLEGKISNFNNFDGINSIKRIKIEIMLSKLTKNLHPVYLLIDMKMQSDAYYKHLNKKPNNLSPS